MPSFVESDVNNLRNSGTGTVNIIEKTNTVISGDFATVLRFLYRDSTFNTYTYEHQKTYLKHGDTIYIFDYAADNREAYSRYLDGAKNILNSITFNSPSVSSESVSGVPPCGDGTGIGTIINMSHLDESTGQQVLDCSG